MMKNSNLFLMCFILLLLGTAAGCTKLDEEVYDKIPVDQFGNSTREINALVGPVYRTLKSVWGSNDSYFGYSEMTSDMAINPTRRGGDGWEGGFFKTLTMHTWSPEFDEYAPFGPTYSNIGTCNMILDIVEKSNIVNKEQALAEIRGVRAFWYYMLLDYYGNVPIVTDFNDLTLPETKTRKQVYEFVLSELNEIKDKVRSDVSSESYGKVTKGVVYTLLAKMYLNAMVWNPEGGEKWQECIAACDEVMRLPYILEPNWKLNFAVHNETSGEIIFPAIFSTADGGNNVVHMTLHYLDPIVFGLNIEAWNMVCAMPDYVKAYDPEDKRLGWSFLTGPMLDPETGDVLITAHGRPLIHTVDITMKYAIDADGWGQVEQEDGARIAKWEFERGLSGRSENDFAIFRLADIYLMKAEALVRSGGDNAEATRLVNEIRERAFDDPSKLKSSVTLNDIYNERRFEFAWEMTTRQDMIRFGTYLNGVPGWRGPSQEKFLLFPIPIEAMDANPKLIQNPGY
ncbi:MAG TPA: RagB/SusD family nutrient uptake outer membrane protein [Agriterribacter sp.]|nr:RagB/SusD family nutrient uptake outer membrane protein [Agriterribacter sp.]